MPASICVDLKTIIITTLLRFSQTGIEAGVCVQCAQLHENEFKENNYSNLQEQQNRLARKSNCKISLLIVKMMMICKEPHEF